MNDGRDLDIPIITVQCGDEPAMFTTHFVEWDDKYQENIVFRDPYQEKLDKLATEKGRQEPEQAPVVLVSKPVQVYEPKGR